MRVRYRVNVVSISFLNDFYNKRFKAQLKFIGNGCDLIFFNPHILQ